MALSIPTGYTFNLDGTCIYLTMAAVFLAQATDTPMSISEQIVLVAVCLIASKGAAAVTGSGFIVLAATIGAVGHVPVASIALFASALIASMSERTGSDQFHPGPPWRRSS